MSIKFYCDVCKKEVNKDNLLYVPELTIDACQNCRSLFDKIRENSVAKLKKECDYISDNKIRFLQLLNSTTNDKFERVFGSSGLQLYISMTREMAYESQTESEDKDAGKQSTGDGGKVGVPGKEGEIPS